MGLLPLWTPKNWGLKSLFHDENFLSQKRGVHLLFSPFILLDLWMNTLFLTPQSSLTNIIIQNTDLRMQDKTSLSFRGSYLETDHEKIFFDFFFSILISHKQKNFYCFSLSSQNNFFSLTSKVGLRNGLYFPDTSRNWPIMAGVFFLMFESSLVYFLPKKGYFSKKDFFNFFWALVRFFIQFMWIPHSKWSFEQWFHLTRTIIIIKSSF